MRIVQLCPYDLERTGGVANHTRDLSAALAALGHDVTIIAPRPKSAHQQVSHLGPGLRIVHVSNGRVFGFNRTSFELTYANRADRMIISGLMQRPYDLIHYHTIWTPFLSWQVYRRAHAPAVATFHDMPPEGRTGDLQRWIYPKILRRLIPRLAGVILPSRAFESYVDLSLAPVSRILPPCIDLARFHPGALPARTFADERINILSLCRLEPRKGLMVLLDAYRQLCERGLPVRLLLAGDGPDRASLTQYVSRNKLPNVVEIGAVRSEDVPGWYAASNIFCAPALYGEGFGIVLIEAMASGKPVVASANAGYRMVLEPETGQLLAPSGDSSALADQLGQLVTDARLRQSLGARATTAAARYDAGKLAPQFVEFYKEALARRKTKS